MAPTLNDFIKEASGYLHQLDDISNTLTEAIQDRSTWQANYNAAKENYEATEAVALFEAMMGDSPIANGKNAEQRSAAKDAMLVNFRKDSHEYKTMCGAKESWLESQSMVEKLEKRFVAVKVQAELISSIIKALSGQA